MIKRNKFFVDNGIKYTYQEVQALENVKNYLLNNDYNKDTIISDIDLVSNCYNINPGHKMIADFDKYYINFLDRLCLETYNFSNVLLNPKDNYFYQELLEYESLPLRTSKNPIIDKTLIEKIIDIKDLKYDKLLYFLLSSDPRCDTLYDKIYNFIVREGITYDSFGKSQKVGWFSKCPESDEMIKENFKIAKDNYDTDLNNTDVYRNYISRYSELEAYNYLKQNLKPYEKIKWVSRYVGDGFGYDIMVINDYENEIKLYEVKGTIKKENERNTSLTNYETTTLLLSEEKNMEYHILRVYIGDNDTRIYDICNTKDSVSSIDNKGFEYLNYKKEDKDKNNKLIYKYQLF